MSQANKNRALRWLLAPVSRVYVGVLFVIVCFVAGWAWKELTATSDRATRDEHSSCVIQARGLPAGHELAASMRDIHMLLTFPPTSAAERRAARNVPPGVLRIERDLAGHLSRYSKAESKQPATRHC